MQPKTVDAETNEQERKSSELTLAQGLGGRGGSNPLLPKEERINDVFEGLVTGRAFLSGEEAQPGHKKRRAVSTY